MRKGGPGDQVFDNVMKEYFNGGLLSGSVAKPKSHVSLAEVKGTTRNMAISLPPKSKKSTSEMAQMKPE